MVKKLITPKSTLKSIFFFRNIKINIKNFDTNPVSGGTPAMDKRVNIQVIRKNCKLPKLFNSFRVLKNLRSNTKIKLNIENNSVV
jgi:hypothetical protein